MVEELLLVSSCLEPNQHFKPILPLITPILKKVISVLVSLLAELRPLKRYIRRKLEQ
jgi:hypothetical protein